MRHQIKSELSIFLGVNLIAPLFYGQAIAPSLDAWRFGGALIVFAIFQILNIWRMRRQSKLRRAYVVIIALNSVALILVGYVAFLSSIPALFSILSSLR